MISEKCIGQVVVLNVNNPFPRIGDEIEIGYQIEDTSSLGRDKFLEDKLKNQNKLYEIFKSYKNRELGKGTLKFTNIIEDTGYNTFGRFSFVVNGIKVESDTVVLYVEKSLPNEENGIWMRQRSYKEQDYLIIEQRISGEWVETKTDDTTKTEFISSSNYFVEIDDKKVKESEITFIFSSSHSQDVVINNKTETVNYKITLYNVNRTGLFNSPLKLNKRNLKNLPKNQKDFEFKLK